MTHKPNPVKYIIKRALQHLAASFGRHTKVSDAPQLLVLMYHRILPADDDRALTEEPGMIVLPETFKLHLEILKKNFEMVQLSEWVALKESGKKLPAKACAITFDDGWADNYEFAFPILKDLKIPATIFLVSDMINTNRQFWPERLAQIISGIAQKCPEKWSHPTLEWVKKFSNGYQFTTVAPTQDELGGLIANTKALSDTEIHGRLDKIEEALSLTLKDEVPPLLNWQQISEMNASGLIEVGSHTCNHIRLTDQLDDHVMEHEIVASKQKIEEKTGRSVKTFCFPNGDYSRKALELVREHYDVGVSTQSGWNSIASDNMLLHRIGIHDDIAKDKVSFLARISGWM